MVTDECCHGYCGVLLWLLRSVVMVTVECCYGY